NLLYRSPCGAPPLQGNTEDGAPVGQGRSGKDPAPPPGSRGRQDQSSTPGSLPPLSFLPSGVSFIGPGSASPPAGTILSTRRPSGVGLSKFTRVIPGPAPFFDSSGTIASRFITRPVARSLTVWTWVFSRALWSRASR